MKECIFCRIANKEITKEFTYEDGDFMVFPDINPVKPIHLLIVPKKHVEELLMIDDEEGLMSNMTKVIKKMIIDHKLEDRGYRVIVNGGGAQVINHLHIHLIGPLGKAAKL